MLIHDLSFDSFEGFGSQKTTHLIDLTTVAADSMASKAMAIASDTRGTSCEEGVEFGGNHQTNTSLLWTPSLGV